MSKPTLSSKKTLDADQILVINLILKMTDREELLSPVMPDLHMLKLSPISSIIALFIPPIRRAFAIHSIRESYVS